MITEQQGSTLDRNTGLCCFSLPTCQLLSRSTRRKCTFAPCLDKSVVYTMCLCLVRGRAYNEMSHIRIQCAKSEHYVWMWTSKGMLFFFLEGNSQLSLSGKVDGCNIRFLFFLPIDRASKMGLLSQRYLAICLHSRNMGSMYNIFVY